MNVIVLTLALMAAHLVAYYTYRRFLAGKIIHLSPPSSLSKVLCDHDGYNPPQRSIFSLGSISLTFFLTIIAGSAVGLIWGLVPSILWVFFGSIFFWAVDDLGILIISIRNWPQFIGGSIAELGGPRVRFLFLIIVFLALLIVIALFTLIIAVLLSMFPQTVIPAWVVTPIACFLGRNYFEKGKNQFWPSILAVILLYFFILVGGNFPIDLTAIFGLSPYSTLICWVVLVLLSDSWLSSSLSISTLTQPRTSINSHQLLIIIVMMIGGLLVSRPAIMIPVIIFNASGAPLIWPFIFVVITCGAVSTFYYVMSSSTTSDHGKSPNHLKFTGYGRIIIESLLPSLVIISVISGISLGMPDGQGGMITGSGAYQYNASSWQTATGLSFKIGLFIHAAANMIHSLGIASKISLGIISVYIVSVAAVIIASATRLQRYVITEFADCCNVSPPPTHLNATILAVISAATLIFINGSSKSAIKLWPLFGSVNQLLAGLFLLIVTIYLVRSKKSLVYSGMPIVIMGLMTGWVMKKNILIFYQDSNWLPFGLGLTIFALELWLITEILLILKQTYSKGPTKTNGINFDLIRHTSFLKDIPRVTFAKIVKYLRVVEFGPGENVIREGDLGDCLFIIQEGTLEVYQGADNDRHVLGIIKEGHAFGEMALLTHARRSASVMTLTPVRLIEFTKDGFEKIISENPSLYPTFIQSIIDNLTAVNEKYCQVVDMFTSEFEKATKGDEGKDLLAFIEKIMVMPFFSTALCQEFIGEANCGEMLKKLSNIPAALVENDAGTYKLSVIFNDFILSNALCQQSSNNIARAKLAHVLQNHQYFLAATRILIDIKEFEAAVEIIRSQLSSPLSSDEDGKNYLAFLNTIPLQFIEPYPALREIIPVMEHPKQDKEVNLQAFGKDLLNLNTAYDESETPPARSIPITKVLGWGLFMAVFPTLFTSNTPSSSFVVIAICAIIMWGFELIDLYMVTIFLLVCCIGKNVASREIIFSGFTSSSFFLTLGVFGLSSAFVSSGLVLRLALWILAIVPFRPMIINFTLAFIGVFITPVLPSANGRLALISPILLEIMDSVGYQPNSTCTRRIAMSTMTGFGLTSCLFLTGKPIHLAIHGMLPAASAATFTWGYWLLAAMVAGLLILGLNLLSATLLYHSDAASHHTLDKSLLKTQLQSLGDLSGSTREIHVILAILILLGGALTSSMHGLGISWFAMLSMLFLMFTGGIDNKSFKSKIDWPFLFFLSGIISFVKIFNHLGLDEQIAGQLDFLKQLIDYNILVFLMALSLIVFGVRFLLPNNVTIVLLSTILIPIAVQAGISPWVPCFAIIVASNVWFLPYQCTFNLTFYSMTAGQLFQHRDLTSFLMINALITLAAIAASIPVWKLMGLL